MRDYYTIHVDKNLTSIAIIHLLTIKQWYLYINKSLNRNLS